MKSNIKNKIGLLIAIQQLSQFLLIPKIIDQFLNERSILIK